jgi:hypothetical protein
MPSQDRMIDPAVPFAQSVPKYAMRQSGCRQQSGRHSGVVRGQGHEACELPAIEPFRNGALQRGDNSLRGHADFSALMLRRGGCSCLRRVTRFLCGLPVDVAPCSGAAGYADEFGFLLAEPLIFVCLHGSPIGAPRPGNKIDGDPGSIGITPSRIF